MRYTSDITDCEWQFIHYCFPKPSKTGRPREHAYRELLNALFYAVGASCQWGNRPKAFAPSRTVYHYFRSWKRSGVWSRVHTHLREHLRQFEGGKRRASAAMINNQSVKRTECSNTRGYEAGKKANGRSQTRPLWTRRVPSTAGTPMPATTPASHSHLHAPPKA